MAKKPEPIQKTLAGLLVEKGDTAVSRMAILLWGPATVGKTTWAATAPGGKLWLSFGDNEHTTVMHRDDVEFINLSNMKYDDLFKHAQSDNPFGLDKYLEDNTDVCSVVVDSVTAIEYKALQKAVGDGVGKGRDFTPTMEVPGLSAYGGRNAIVIQTITGLLRVTAKHNVHIIFTAHEADPVMSLSDKGTIDYYAIMLGGKLINNVTWRLSEIWFMFQETTGNRERGIAIRGNHRKRKPMKTRMFALQGSPEFYVDYDPDKPDKGQMTIASFYDQWVEGGMRKIPVPTNTRAKK